MKGTTTLDYANGRIHITADYEPHVYGGVNERDEPAEFNGFDSVIWFDAKGVRHDITDLVGDIDNLYYEFKDHFMNNMDGVRKGERVW